MTHFGIEASTLKVNDGVRKWHKVVTTICVDGLNFICRAWTLLLSFSNVWSSKFTHWICFTVNIKDFCCKCELASLSKNRIHSDFSSQAFANLLAQRESDSIPIRIETPALSRFDRLDSIKYFGHLFLWHPDTNISHGDFQYMHFRLVWLESYASSNDN